MSQRHPITNEEIMLVTTNCKNRRSIFDHPPYAHEAIDVLYRVQSLHPFFLYGFVFMPDHCHLLMRVPEPQSVSKIMDRFKMGISHSIGIGPIWQPRFHMRIAENPGEALRYIHLNPVRANLTDAAEKFRWSSASGKWDVTELPMNFDHHHRGQVWPL